MLTNPREIAVNRKNTAAFIDADYELVTLTPRTKTRSNTGGFTWTKAAPRAPQKFHFGERVTNAMPNNHVPGGTQRTEDYTLLGNWDAAIEVNDIFTRSDGSEWEVVALQTENGYERRATVIRYGA